jgi:hypothetical protein
MTTSAVKPKETFTFSKVIGEQWQMCLQNERSSCPKEKRLQTSQKIHAEIP